MIHDRTQLTTPALTAKTSSSYAQPGRQPLRSAFHWARLTLLQFKENPDAWLLVDKILQDAQYPQTKCTFA